MKISITEFRDMVAEAIRQTISEAKRKPKEVAPRSEESILAQRDAQVRGLPGYAHGNVLDMSKPLGRKNRTKMQGASNIGGWTSEGHVREAGEGSWDGDTQSGDPQADRQASMLMQVLQSNGIPFDKAQKIASQFSKVDPAEHGLDDPKELGIEQKHEAVRRLVRMIVREQIRVSR